MGARWHLNRVVAKYWACAFLLFITGQMFINVFLWMALAAALAITGALLAMYGLYSAAKDGTYRSLAMPLIVFSLVASLLSPQTVLVGIYARTLIEVPSYRSAIKENGPEGIPRCIDRTKCNQEGRWIIFSWGGLLDNWEGIVYDPTKTIEMAPQRNRRAFGGDMVYARNLWGPWYYCSFT